MCQVCVMKGVLSLCMCKPTHSLCEIFFFFLLFPQMVECCSECLLSARLQRTEGEISTVYERRRRESQKRGSVGGRVGKNKGGQG